MRCSARRSAGSFHGLETTIVAETWLRDLALVEGVEPGEIAIRIADEFGIEPESVEADVSDLVEMLRKSKLVKP
ncbi:PqqD family protein [Saccharopolyspora pogona]|uniref:PqqD family protein n=1 Tax=Saccharopolyspora pogona TaxID=333966 RepID=UPI0016875A71|nr:PqqD family protein [Saccharopolyspora pogona]